MTKTLTDIAIKAMTQEGADPGRQVYRPYCPGDNWS